ncbi:MAG TPA: carbohydrate-binding family 9-like protein [Candidatus Aminicenantes bacterium]|nr:carbohydrate-binding family 9-like protein [Candidatus Aminicenantes bacterium]HRY65264.1 carbohydrate-binding family 9-like protein [Candidatus Aminicenantes bacterium]HRZ72268.1 carbohydrate-binding family 9-like protein [Candidatus Aminicenantes bacterium]
MDRYLWLANGYEPRVEARLGWSPRFLYVHFRVAEKPAPVRYSGFQDPVYKDSCVEFFIDACPEKKLGYVNFEMNSAGALLAAFGPDRDRRTPLRTGDLAGLTVGRCQEDRPGVGGSWAVWYNVPLELFRRLYGREIAAGQQAAANFYKCGDETPVPHYGAWSPVGTPAPDFHRPEYFGRLVFGR